MCDRFETFLSSFIQYSIGLPYFFSMEGKDEVTMRKRNSRQEPRFFHKFLAHRLGKTEDTPRSSLGKTHLLV